MLTSEKKLDHTLRIRISEEYKYLVNITVFDSNNRIIESQSSNKYEVSFTLPHGLYTLRIEMNGDIKDEVILLNKEKEYQVGDQNSFSYENIKIISPPKQFSSALLGETYGSSHEYYTYPAIDWSKRETFQFNQDNINLNSSLFIFLRFPSIEKFDKLRSSFSKPFYSDFEIVDEYGSILTQFETKIGVVINEQQGWVAFNAKLPNGIYYLLYKGKEPRQMPIYIYKNWHTQFFMTLGNQPIFGTTRIFLSRQREFNPIERTYKYIDILLDKLQNQDFSLDNELIEMAAYGKYESPMLGLICSYIYLQSKETKSDNLFNIITQNIQKVILKDNAESPDLRALNILASNHFSNYNYKKTTVQGTPMFRIGFEAILKASVENKRLISQNSINDFISENLYFDSPFSSFKPIPFIKKSPKKQDIIEEKVYEGNDMNATMKENTNVQKNISSKKNVPHLNLSNSQQRLTDTFLEFNIEKPNSERPKFRITRSKLKMTKVKSKTKAQQAKSMPITIKFSTDIKNLLDDKTLDFIKLKKDPDIENSWIKSSIVDIIKLNKDVSINDISNNLSISGSTVNRIFLEWKKEATKFKK